jgi:tRNA (mo5U34)-methyltransferase
MIHLTDEQLHDFQEAVPWTTALRLRDGRVLGAPGKRGAISEGQDFRVAALAERFAMANARILELGCHEGSHTVQLAEIAREVIGVEVRPRNVVCALVRLFVHDARNARVVLGDVRALGGDLGRFDILFHVGVLYHLSNPAEHLADVADMADVILLDTHYETFETSRERADLAHDGRFYAAFVFHESGWTDPFSGVEPTSRWLERDALLSLVRDVGFGRIELLSDRIERNGHRITLIGHKASD